MRHSDKDQSSLAERWLTWLLVAAIHGGLAWLVTQAPIPAPASVDDDVVLDVVWIPAPKPPPSSQLAAMPIARPASTQRSRNVHARPAVEPVTADGVAPVVARPTIVDLSGQARLPEPATPDSFRADPLANRSVHLPGRAANTFRMRPSLSPAERMAKLARLFGGGDDPCRSARDSVNALSQAGDSRELRDVLDYERRYCR